MTTQSYYQQAIVFATNKHVEKDQKVPGTNMPYVVHLSNVAMEILIASANTSDFDTDFAIQLALLHDTMEDTDTTYQELSDRFGKSVADGVEALTKNDSLAKDMKMMDSLSRIKKLSKEVASVKLADRITNMQKPPAAWHADKRRKYQEEARIILHELKGSNDYLENRLRILIEAYGSFIGTNG